MKTALIEQIIGKSLKEELSEEESVLLEQWLAEKPEHREFFERLKEPGYIAAEVQQMSRANWRVGFARFLEKYPLPVSAPSAAVVRIRVKRLAIAASVLLVLAAGSWLWLRDRQPAPAPELTAKVVPADLPAGGPKAILTLANNQQIILGEDRQGLLAQQGGTAIANKGRQLEYNASAATAGERLYNSVTTPRGGEYTLVLPDGSKAWLNAASSIRFPTSFAGSRERQVEITGEVFFDVAANRSQPFIVMAGGAAVKVLGTQFNINAYTDEAAISTTLVTGAVEVKKGNNRKRISPGEQARVLDGDQVRVVEADVEMVTAWRQNQFSFKGASIEEVMRQIARWYDVEQVVYEGKVTQTFTGTISRNISAASLLKGIGEIGYTRFSIEGKRIIVSAAKP